MSFIFGGRIRRAVGLRLNCARTHLINLIIALLRKFVLKLHLLDFNANEFD